MPNYDGCRLVATMTLCELLVLLMASSITIYSVPCQAQKCNYTFSYLNGAVGNFSSPGFPDYYPSLLRCTYLFDAAKNGGVEIKFDAFELEDGKEGEQICRYDYIDVYTMDSQGFKTLLNKFCGRKIPQTIISPQSKLEIVFVTDHWQNSATGFSGRYRFLGEDWQPFDHKANRCGNDNLSGVAGFIQSPNYPRKYPPNVNCSWVINVPENQQILLRLLDLDISHGPHCTDAKLQLYNGYATTMSVYTREWCGLMSSYDTDELQYVTFTNRMVVRFLSGSNNNNHHFGFKLLWMGITLPQESGECTNFRCEGGQYCHNGLPCVNLPKYCISRQLVCDGIRNCGPFDDSDERRCMKEILIITACIAVPSVILLMTVGTIVYCYKSRHVKKSTSEDQQLTHSQSQGTTSRESFNRQMILHTSFIDGASAVFNDQTLLPDFNDLGQIEPNYTSHIYSDESSRSLQTHKKRPSYHMMQQSYEDGNLIMAQS
ncbi:unnamed protein product [Lymnaea stagnalis]|uniref:CUB domain-containing protein n=1 Tax=Lymnaea stagnalis TaxID=6523 RepID=A0AAV2H3K9_LYMST